MGGGDIPFNSTQAQAGRLLSGLLEGRSPVVRHRTLHGGDALEIRLLPARFAKAYEDYRACTAKLLPVNFDQLRQSQIGFPSSDVALDALGRAKLDIILQYLRADPSVNRIQLDGHSDNSGNRLVNRDLSRRRALAVQEYLIANGVPEQQITVRFHGERYPLVANSSEANRQEPASHPASGARGSGRGELDRNSGAIFLTARPPRPCKAAPRPVESQVFRITRGADGMADVKKVVLAYSGGLDTSVILKWLQDTYNCEVVTFTADLGQGEEVEPARAKAQALGVKEIYIDDLREEFVRDFVFPMFRANTVYEGEYLLGTSIARPLIAKRLIEIANETGADAISHGATGKGNDQVRFELGAYALKPGVKVIARGASGTCCPAKLMDYAEKHAIPIERHGKKKSPYSMDANLLHISYEGGVLEDTWTEHEEDMWRWTKSRKPRRTPRPTSS